MTIPTEPATGKAAEAPQPRKAWTTPQVRRLATSEAEAGATTNTDGLEVLS
jgi:hypothetical protein